MVSYFAPKSGETGDADFGFVRQRTDSSPGEENSTPAPNKTLQDFTQEDDESYQDHLSRKKKEKWALVFIVAVGVGILLIGFFQLKGLISVPFPVSSKKSTAQPAVVKEEPKPLAQEDPEKLKKQDTDTDGISDFDEIYVYQTSPYLGDSDSDGIADMDEIKVGTDPNCPEGQTCFMTSTPQANAGSDATSAQNQGTTGITPAQLRALLLKTGKLTQDQLNQLDDQTLMSIYEETISADPALKAQLESALNGQAAKDTASTPATMEEAVKKAQSASIDDIKKMLRQQGVEESLLSQVDDATLRKLYEEALSKAGSSVDKK